MSIEVLVPNLPESVSDATLITWHKQPGDTVIKNENLVDLETDKVVLEVPAPASGILGKILKEDGSIVVGGEVLALLEPQAVAEGQKTAATAPEPEDEDESDIPLSPSVRRLIAENALNPSVIKGSGKDGRLTKTDVLDYLHKKTLQEAQLIVPTAKAEIPLSPPLTKGETATAISHPTPKEEAGRVISNLRPEQRVPMTRLRAKVAERLLQAQQNAAMLTTFNEVNMQNVIDLRNQYKERFEKKAPCQIGLYVFLCQGVYRGFKALSGHQCFHRR